MTTRELRKRLTIKGKTTIKTKTYKVLEFKVNVLERDIDEGKCLLANKCMAKVATARTLDQLYPIAGSHKVRVDAGHIKFNAKGFRWLADTPKIVATNLKWYDNKKTRHLVKPFAFKVKAHQVSKIHPGSPFTKERRRQINEARRERERRTGIKESGRYTLRHRIVGFT